MGLGVGYHTQQTLYRYTARPRLIPDKSINMDPSEISRLIEAGFENAEVKVMSDDNTHYAAIVVAAEFDGKRSIARHQMVYKTLGSLVGNEIHALSIRALTPDEWREEEAR